jgi:hypothetical protein
MARENPGSAPYLSLSTGCTNLKPARATRKFNEPASAGNGSACGEVDAGKTADCSCQLSPKPLGTGTMWQRACWLGAPQLHSIAVPPALVADTRWPSRPSLLRLCTYQQTITTPPPPLPRPYNTHPLIIQLKQAALRGRREALRQPQRDHTDQRLPIIRERAVPLQKQPQNVSITQGAPDTSMLSLRCGTVADSRSSCRDNDRRPA